MPATKSNDYFVVISKDPNRSNWDKMLVLIWVVSNCFQPKRVVLSLRWIISIPFDTKSSIKQKLLTMISSAARKLPRFPKSHFKNSNPYRLSKSRNQPASITFIFPQGAGLFKISRAESVTTGNIDACIQHSTS